MSVVVSLQCRALFRNSVRSAAAAAAQLLMNLFYQLDIPSTSPHFSPVFIGCGFCSGSEVPSVCPDLFFCYLQGTGLSHLSEIILEMADI